MVLFSQQENNILLHGKVIADSLEIENVHLINVSNSKGTITNKAGKFKLSSSIGDTIIVSHINYKKKLIVIEKQHKKLKNIIIKLQPKVYILTEVSIKKRQPIFYNDPEIMPPHIANTTALKLPYTKTTTKKNEKITNATLTSFSVNIENLINAINGNTKKAKELRRAKLEDKKLKEIRVEFTDYFFTNQLNIKKQYINQFLNYCLGSGILIEHTKDNKLKITEILLRESKTFPHTQIDSNKLLSKN